MWTVGLGCGQLNERRPDGRHGLERALSQHAFGELQVELVFECEHDVDAGVRRHTGLKEILVILYARHVDREATVLGQNATNLLVHHPTPFDASSRSCVFLGWPGTSSSLQSATTTAAAMPSSWVRLTASSPIPARVASSAAWPDSDILHQPSGWRRTSIDRQSGRCPLGRRTLSVASLAANRAAKPADVTDGGPANEAMSWSVWMRRRDSS